MNRSDFFAKHHSGWDINKGDYKPDSQSSNSYVKSLKRNYILKRIAGITVYGVVVWIVAYLILI